MYFLWEGIPKHLREKWCCAASHADRTSTCYRRRWSSLRPEEVREHVVSRRELFLQLIVEFRHLMSLNNLININLYSTGTNSPGLNSNSLCFPQVSLLLENKTKRETHDRGVSSHQHQFQTWWYVCYIFHLDDIICLIPLVL